MFFVRNKTFARHTDLKRLTQYGICHQGQYKIALLHCRQNMCQQRLDSVWSSLCDKGLNVAHNKSLCSDLALADQQACKWNPTIIPRLQWIPHVSVATSFAAFRATGIEGTQALTLCGSSFLSLRIIRSKDLGKYRLKYEKKIFIIWMYKWSRSNIYLYIYIFNFRTLYILLKSNCSHWKLINPCALGWTQHEFKGGFVTFCMLIPSSVSPNFPSQNWSH